MAAQGIGVVSGVTVQVHVGDLAAGVRFYSTLLGRGPDVAPHEDFKEWELSPGAWLQLAEGGGPLPHPLRLGVDDLHRSRKAVLALGVACQEPEYIPPAWRRGATSPTLGATAWGCSRTWRARAGRPSPAAASTTPRCATRFEPSADLACEPSGCTGRILFGGRARSRLAHDRWWSPRTGLAHRPSWSPTLPTLSRRRPRGACHLRAISEGQSRC